MASESKLRKLQMPEDELDTDVSEELEGEEETEEDDLDFEDEESPEDEESALASFSDEELQAEMERRGLTGELEDEEAEEMDFDDEPTEDEEELDFDELDGL